MASQSANDDIVLGVHSAKLSLSSNGAYVRNLIVNGEDLLFPAQLIGEKLRGGIPVCAPIFGPGDAVGLRQHGFARDVEWTVLRQSDDEAILIFSATARTELPISYQGCVMMYTVKIRENSLFLSLTIENHGETPFVCSPGFHPYFRTGDATKVTVKSDIARRFTADELAVTQFLPPYQEEVTAQFETYDVTLRSATLQRYAVWSANPEKYICVEPTYVGNLDVDTAMPLLQPGERREFDMAMSWEIAV